MLLSQSVSVEICSGITPESKVTIIEVLIEHFSTISQIEFCLAVLNLNLASSIPFVMSKKYILRY